MRNGQDNIVAGIAQRLGLDLAEAQGAYMQAAMQNFVRGMMTGSPSKSIGFSEMSLDADADSVKRKAEALQQQTQQQLGNIADKRQKQDEGNTQHTNHAAPMNTNRPEQG